MNTADHLEQLKKALPSSDVLTQCMHCGMCLAVCPTYDLTKLERSSPRGRIRMIKSLADGNLKMTPEFLEEMDFCLDCQACETACPAGVTYGVMVESARDLAGKTIRKYDWVHLVKKFSLNVILANKFVFHIISKLLSIIQKYRIDKWLAESGIIRRLIPNAPELLKLLPTFSSESSDTMLEERMAPYGEKKYTVAFLTGCLMDTAFTQTNIATVELLRKLGCEVVVPRGQVCCGSLHAHNGEMDKAKKLAKQNVKVFSSHRYDFLVSNSAGCGAFMKEYKHVFEDQEELHQMASDFSKKVLDITEFMSLPDITYQFKTVTEKITYHDACHLCHTQKIVNQPRNIIQKIPNVHYTPLEQASWCCGSAGIYNIMRNADAMKFLAKKTDNIKKSEAEVVLTGNPGCFLQIKYGLEKEGIPCRVEHTAEYFNSIIQAK